MFLKKHSNTFIFSFGYFIILMQCKYFNAKTNLTEDKNSKKQNNKKIV